MQSGSIGTNGQPDGVGLGGVFDVATGDLLRLECEQRGSGAMATQRAIPRLNRPRSFRRREQKFLKRQSADRACELAEASDGDQPQGEDEECRVAQDREVGPEPGEAEEDRCEQARDDPAQPLVNSCPGEKRGFAGSRTAWIPVIIRAVARRTGHPACSRRRHARLALHVRLPSARTIKRSFRSRPQAGDPRLRSFSNPVDASFAHPERMKQPMLND
jgi:hypothetical protein